MAGNDDEENSRTKGKAATMTDADITKSKQNPDQKRGKWRPKYFYRAYATDWEPIIISKRNTDLRQRKLVPRSDKKYSPVEGKKSLKVEPKYPGLKRVFQKKDSKDPCEIIENNKTWPKTKLRTDSNKDCKRKSNQLVIKQTSASGAAKKVVTQLHRADPLEFGPFSFYLLQRVQKPEPAKDMTRVYLYSGSFVNYEKAQKRQIYDTGKRNKKPFFTTPTKQINRFKNGLSREGISVVEKINSFTVPFTLFEDIKNAAKLKLLVPSTNLMRRFNYAKDPKTGSRELWMKLKNEVRRFGKEKWEEKLKPKSEAERIKIEKKMIRRVPKVKKPRSSPSSSENNNHIFPALAAAVNSPPSMLPALVQPDAAVISPKKGGQHIVSASMKMKDTVTTLMAQAFQLALDLKKVLKGKANLKRAKTIWNAAQIKKVREVIKNSPK